MHPFNLLGGNNQFANMLQQFQQFKSTFQGNPRDQVQQLLNSGRMSQAQYNQLQAMAQQFQKLLK